MVTSNANTYNILLENKLDINEVRFNGLKVNSKTNLQGMV